MTKQRRHSILEIVILTSLVRNNKPMKPMQVYHDINTWTHQGIKQAFLNLARKGFVEHPRPKSPYAITEEGRRIQKANLDRIKKFKK